MPASDFCPLTHLFRFKRDSIWRAQAFMSGFSSWSPMETIRALGLPRTVMSIDVAIRLIDVADGTLEYVNVISASASKGEGFSLFPSDKEDRMSQLSGVDLTELQERLVREWAASLRQSMFEDRSIVVQ